MTVATQQHGAALIAVVFFVVIMSMLAGVTAYLVAGDSAGSVDQLASEQALYIAQGGAEVAAFQFKNGTACNALTNTNVALGSGTYTTSGDAGTGAPPPLSAALSATDTVIPVTTLAGLAASGRVTIGAEEIYYTGTSNVAAACSPFTPPCLTGANRGQSGTAAAPHPSGSALTQAQCLIRSTGTAGNAQRRVDVLMQPVTAAFLDGASVGVGTATTTLGTLATTLTAGDNIVLGKVSFRNTNANRQIAPGNLRLLRGGTVLATNQFIIDVGRSPPSNNNFPQETQYLLVRDAGAPANATYSVTASATNTNINSEVKMIAFNGVPNSSFQDGGGVAVGTATTTLMTHNSTVPAGTNVLMAVVQIDNTSNGTRSINPGNLRLLRGATVLSTNEFALNLARQSRVNQGTGMLLLARDVGAPANPVYTVTGLASGNGLIAEAKVVVLNGVQSAFFDGGSVAVGTAPTTTGALATTFPVGTNLVIASTQYDNSSGALRSILAGNERIVFGGVAQATSAYDIDLCSSGGTSACDDFDKGIMWRQNATAPNPAYSLQVFADNTGIAGETKLLAVHLGSRVADWRELIQ